MNLKRISENFDAKCRTLNGIAWMSFMWSCSSLMVFSILPAFLVDELHVSHLKIGWLEGLAYASSFASKFLSGLLSDVMKNRKPLIIFGTVLSALTKPFFALCTNSFMLFGIRIGDRVSKGIRSAPTDALIADVSQKEMYASNFGLRQSLYTLGAVFGAILAMVLMLLSDNNYRLVFWLSFIPAFVALIILFFVVKPAKESHPRFQKKFRYQSIKISDFKKFSPSFWFLNLGLFFLMLSRFSEAFLTLRAKNVGLGIAFLPALIIVMDLVHAGVALPSGKWADKFSRHQVLLAGLLIMIASHIVFVSTGGIFGVLVGIILCGCHMGMTQGLLKALIAESTPPELRGTAFSFFFLVSGTAILIGNPVAGALSQNFGTQAPFLGGGIFTFCSFIILYFTFAQKRAKTFNSSQAKI